MKVSVDEILKKIHTCTLTLTEEQVTSGKEWIRTHKGTQVLDTPLWVLISLGILALEEEDDVTR